jgi:chitin synthase
VPPQVLQYCTNKEENEFSHMRYSAVTSQPDDFQKDQFTLRQQLYNPPRETELFIGITMYNEDRELLYRTLHGVFQNISYLCSLEDDSVWGKDSWKKIVVGIISDGRNKINISTLCAIAALGAYEEDVAVISVENDDEEHTPVVTDIYEYSTQVPISLISPYSTQDEDRNVPPVQLLFCLKRENQKKINSHRWFFNAFGRALNPHVCVLLDVGTQPGPQSIYHLWKAFHTNASVGGACGEIVAMKGKYGQNLINPLVATQNFEYKMSNILDKSLESVFGYITVLPGAFSAYRYVALQNDEHGEGPLQTYFMGDLQQGQTTDIFTANMYLAEDRVCSIVIQWGHSCLNAVGHVGAMLGACF